jgi:hypothetical protein
MAAYAMRLRGGSGEYRFACIEDIGFGAMPRGVQAPPGRLFSWRGDDSSVSPTKRADYRGCLGIAADAAGDYGNSRQATAW